MAQRRQRKPAAEKPPAPAPSVTSEARAAFDARPQPPPKLERPLSTRGRAKPTGRKPLPQHLEVEEHALRPDACAHCGSGELDVADEVVEEKLHVIKEHCYRPAYVIRAQFGRPDPLSSAEVIGLSSAEVIRTALNT